MITFIACAAAAWLVLSIICGLCIAGVMGSFTRQDEACRRDWEARHPTVLPFRKAI